MHILGPHPLLYGLVFDFDLQAAGYYNAKLLVFAPVRYNILTGVDLLVLQR